MACHLCGDNQFEAVSNVDAKSGKQLIVGVCVQCGLVQQTPMPTAEELRQFYSQDYRLEYKGVATPKPKHVLRAGRKALDRIRFLQSNVTEPIHSLLDIGAGGGEFVYLCGRHGIEDACGIEPNEGYSQYARQELDVSVTTGELSELPDRQFDAITLFHVLEHLIHPRDVFHKLASICRSDGLLLIEVPWLESRSQSPTNIFFKAHTLYFAVETLVACGSESFDPQLVSTDQGVLRVLFRKRQTQQNVILPPPDAVARIRRHLQSHGWISYLMQGDGLTKPFQKLSRGLSESSASGKPPQQILDELVTPKSRAA